MHPTGVAGHLGFEIGDQETGPMSPEREPEASPLENDVVRYPR
jgi:hypothetical protein